MDISNKSLQDVFHIQEFHFQVHAKNLITHKYTLHPYVILLLVTTNL